MYINPFLAGILVTIIVEIIVVFYIAISGTLKNKDDAHDIGVGSIGGGKTDDNND